MIASQVHEPEDGTRRPRRAGKRSPTNLVLDTQQWPGVLAQNRRRTQSFRSDRRRRHPKHVKIVVHGIVTENLQPRNICAKPSLGVTSKTRRNSTTSMHSAMRPSSSSTIWPGATSQSGSTDPLRSRRGFL